MVGISISKIYKGIALSSPRIEVFLRQLYWKNVDRLGKFNPHKGNKTDKSSQNNKVDFDEVIKYLQDNGVGNGSILIVHSSYEALMSTGLQPQDIINRLLDLVGEDGTLAMPAIRKFKGLPKMRTDEDELEQEYIYNTRTTKLSSGVLPCCMLMREDSEISRFPLNPLVAIGKNAKEMMIHNIDGNLPSPHGKDSAWKYCHDHQAIVIGLGVTLEHYNTMIHVAEEAFGKWNWPSEKWFKKRRFLIEDGDFKQSIIVRDRKPSWGHLHFAEMNLWKDLTKEGIVKTTVFNNVLPLSIEKADRLVSFLRNKNRKGYPYF